jgi:GH25 family lysozyme M1 (1,4-beta-N-acetylmuramidase)
MAGTLKPRPLRAGGVSAPSDVTMALATIATAGPATLFADVSEFQPDIADATYVSRFSKAIVIRAMYGDAHDDGAWYGGARRADLWAAGIQWMGIYQYLVASQDPAAQARAYIRLLGHIADGEVPICDLEEGTGDQDPRWLAWRAEVMAAWPDLARRPAQGQPQLYSGLNFAENGRLAPGWVADYSSAEPSTAWPHWAWQFTDAYPIPGVGTADCSIYHGTAQQLRALATAGSSPPPTGTVTMEITLPVLREGMSDPVNGSQIIHRLQGVLAAIGKAWGNTTLEHLTIDGVFGPATRSAVETVQRQFRITASGVVDEHTWPPVLAG